MVTESKKNAWNEIVNNVERLVIDANILQKHQRYGSAMSIAILAFEESGKGSIYETDFRISSKGRSNVGSSHILRQIVSSIFLTGSVLQKYGIELPPLPDEIMTDIADCLESNGSLQNFVQAPIPDDIRKKLRLELDSSQEILNKLKILSEEDRLIFTLELRWARKLLVSSVSKRTEQLRQNGMYVDINGNDISSSPMKIDGTTSQYWIQVAERSLLILRDGNYAAPYGTLASYLESLERPFDPSEALRDHARQLAWLESKFVQSEN